MLYYYDYLINMFNLNKEDDKFVETFWQKLQLFY